MTNSRRRLLCTLFLALVAPVVAEELPRNEYLMFVGTYTGKDSKGIYAYRYDTATAQLTPRNSIGKTWRRK